MPNEGGEAVPLLIRAQGDGAYGPSAMATFHDDSGREMTLEVIRAEPT